MNFDFIGDIHGHAAELEALLLKLGYQQKQGCYSHPQQQAIFLGDFIDRGPEQRAVVDVVRPMVEAGAAQAVMGNHEFNALAYATENPAQPGRYLRKHSERNQRQHAAFLTAYRDDPRAMRDALDWFKTLSLWLDLGEARVVHACWDEKAMQVLQPALGPNNVLTDDLLVVASDSSTPEYTALELLLKGLEVPLPDGVSYADKEGVSRRHARVRWWRNELGNYQQIAIVPSSVMATLPSDLVPEGVLPGYGASQPLVVMGHYWMGGEPALLAPNVACVDYSVARPEGKLVALRAMDDQALQFIQVDRG